MRNQGEWVRGTTSGQAPSEASQNIVLLDSAKRFLDEAIANLSAAHPSPVRQSTSFLLAMVINLARQVRSAVDSPEDHSDGHSPALEESGDDEGDNEYKHSDRYSQHHLGHRNGGTCSSPDRRSNKRAHPGDVSSLSTQSAHKHTEAGVTPKRRAASIAAAAVAERERGKTPVAAEGDGRHRQQTDRAREYASTEQQKGLDVFIKALQMLQRSMGHVPLGLVCKEARRVDPDFMTRMGVAKFTEFVVSAQRFLDIVVQLPPGSKPTLRFKNTYQPYLEHRRSAFPPWSMQLGRLEAENRAARRDM